jgi:predicted XRE-type DNA-binding protein
MRGLAQPDTMEKIAVKGGSDNVFADPGLPNPDEHLAKADLASRINALIREAGLTQVAAAALLGIDQPKVSRLARGYLARFSVEHLIKFLTLLGRDVEIGEKIRPALAVPALRYQAGRRRAIRCRR